MEPPDRDAVTDRTAAEPERGELAVSYNSVLAGRDRSDGSVGW